MNHELALTLAGCMFAAMFAAAPLLYAAEPPPAAQPKAAPDTRRPAPSVPVTAATTRKPKDKTAARQNCGTFWTGWTEDPNTEFNPCPQGCVRGERQVVKTHKQGDILLYDARYQCYRMATVTPPKREPQGGIKKHPRDAFRPKVITTAPMQLTGTRRPPFVPKAVTTGAMQLTGTRRPLFVPKVITAGSMQLTGTRRPPFAPLAITSGPVQLTGTRRPPFTPKVFTTGSIQLTGTRLRKLPLDAGRPLNVLPADGAPFRPRGN